MFTRMTLVWSILLAFLSPGCANSEAPESPPPSTGFDVLKGYEERRRNDPAGRSLTFWEAVRMLQVSGLGPGTWDRPAGLPWSAEQSRSFGSNRVVARIQTGASESVQLLSDDPLSGFTAPRPIEHVEIRAEIHDPEHHREETVRQFLMSIGAVYPRASVIPPTNRERMVVVNEIYTAMLAGQAWSRDGWILQRESMPGAGVVFVFRRQAGGD